MKLMLDAGNTRIKWVLANDGKWEERGVISVDHSSDLKKLVKKNGSVEQIWASNVAGERVEKDIRDLGIQQTNFIQSQKTCCGVRNGYKDPKQLGSDRWLAMIAAWNLKGDKCLVVNSGTATTIDALSESGEFQGGLILPGLEMMIESLSLNTSGLKKTQGEFQEFPCSTADAITSGVIQATCGAIDRQRDKLGGQDIPVILSGGAAHMLEKHLGKVVQTEEYLVLLGIEQVSEEKRTI